MTAPAAPEPLVIGVDIGGTAIKGVLAGRDGAPRLRLDRPTPVGEGVDAVVEAIVDIASRLRDSAGHNAVPVGVGLVMPGVVDRAQGIARWSANIGWRDLPIRELVGERLGLPVDIEHDVRAAGLAEVSGGAARGLRELLYVSIGTGLAGALITGGAVVHGAAGLAGEIGHVPVFPEGEECACGQRGCAEAYASAASVARRYARASGGAVVPAEVVLARAAEGDAAARAVLDVAVVALTRMVLGVVLLADPEVVVLGGGMAAARSALTEPVFEGLRGALTWRSPPPVIVSQFGSDAGVRGAALLAWTLTDEPGQVV
ncbi:MAG: ROK family protein [Blastococcus sp.]